MVHLKGYMYKWIMQDLGKNEQFCFFITEHCQTRTVTEFIWLFADKYILRGEETDAVLHKLVDNGKKLFLITNSPFSFV